MKTRGATRSQSLASIFAKPYPSLQIKVALVIKDPTPKLPNFYILKICALICLYFAQQLQCTIFVNT